MYLLLYCFWLLLNGRITAEVCILGAVIVAAMALLIYALFGYTPKKELRLLKKTPLFVCYIFVLLWEIIKANFAVLRFIVGERGSISPTLVTFSADLRTGFGRFLLANSITLTPGTITVRVEGSRFTVHCLKRTMLDTSENGVFLRWIRRLEA